MDSLQEIKRQFRRAMNGIVSNSMREKGVDYKINFGLTLPLIRRIAGKYEPDAVLAGQLWKENIRESKMLAVLLYPVHEFRPETMQQWAESIPYREIADLCCMHLFNRVPYAEEKAVEWISSENEMLRYTGFQLLARIAGPKAGFSPERLSVITQTVTGCSEQFSHPVLQAALNSLKRIMCTDRESAEFIKNAFPLLPDENPTRLSRIAEEIADEYAFLYE
ncbi:MAG: DNA alkylation repair protein [Coprobacter sp.]|nr:DNA alkylation repair protein [Coprobacter sp.]